MKGRSNKGFTLIELLIVVAIIGIIAAIAIPGLLAARRAGNEASAIGSMRAISSGEATYASGCGAGYYAGDLGTLGSVAAGTGAFISMDMVPTSGTVSAKSGYNVEVTNAGLTAATNVTGCNGAPPVYPGFNGTATPQTTTTGTRHFAISEGAAIYQATTAITFNASRANTGGTPLQ